MLKKYALHKPENWFLLLTLALCLFVRFRHLDIAFERDEGEYAYAAQAILRGELPYRDFYNMKLPGVYYTLAAVFNVFGDSARVVKLFLIFMNLASAFLLFQIAKNVFNGNKGIEIGKQAAAAYLLLSLGYSLQGWTANAEHFVVFFALFGIYWFLIGFNRQKNWLLVLSGIITTWAFICKQHGLGYLIFPSVYLLVIWWYKRSKQLFWKDVFIPNLCYGLGFFSAFGGLLFYNYTKNNLGNIHFFSVDYANAYGDFEVPFLKIWHFRPIFWNACVLWFIALATIYFTIKQKPKNEKHLFLLAFAFCAFLCIHPGWYYRPHYFQLLTPAFALLAAVGLQNTEGGWKRFEKRFFRYPVKSFLVSLALISCLAAQWQYYFVQSSKQLTDVMYPYNYFNETKELADKLPNIMGKDSKIGIIGAEPQVFFYSKKINATGFLYNYPIYEKQVYAHMMADTMLHQFERNQPEIFIVSCIIDSDNDRNYETANKVENWFANYSKDYKIIGKIYGDRNEGQLIWKEQDSSIDKKTLQFEIWLKKKKEIR
jgi:4-amino-4-deoxy-L-arabinose transferase-like glycosyltransferase